MVYNPEIHHRKSIRLKGYDYSSNGAYFITMCLNNRACLFGDIKNGNAELNKSGNMVNSWWLKLAEKFPSVDLDEYIIMPNHFHGIVLINNEFENYFGSFVGVAPCVNPLLYEVKKSDINIQQNEEGNHVGLPQRSTTLSEIIQWFKTMTTNEYIRNVKQHDWEPFDKKLWQRNYYEVIIRNEKTLNNIRKYIIENPMKWQIDRENEKGDFEKHQFKSINEVNNFEVNQ